jgi:hypothetical protein
MMEIKSQGSEDGPGFREDAGDSKDMIHYQDQRHSTRQRDPYDTSTSTRGERNRPSEPTSSRRSSNNQGRTPNHQQKKQLEEYERQKRENHEMRIKNLSNIILSKIEVVVKYPDYPRELYRERSSRYQSASCRHLATSECC